MEEAQTIYVIDEGTRKALLAVLTKAVHPNISFEQVNAVITHLEEMKPVQVVQGPPVAQPTQPQVVAAPQDPVVGPREE